MDQRSCACVRVEIDLAAVAVLDTPFLGTTEPFSSGPSPPRPRAPTCTLFGRPRSITKPRAPCTQRSAAFRDTATLLFQLLPGGSARRGVLSYSCSSRPLQLFVATVVRREQNSSDKSLPQYYYDKHSHNQSLSIPRLPTQVSTITCRPSGTPSLVFIFCRMTSYSRSFPRPRTPLACNRFCAKFLRISSA